MKKLKDTKLQLRTEQIRKLTQDQMRGVVGGADGAGGSGPTHRIGIGIDGDGAGGSGPTHLIGIGIGIGG
jgi:hypothetical protein